MSHNDDDNRHDSKNVLKMLKKYLGEAEPRNEHPWHFPEPYTPLRGRYTGGGQYLELPVVPDLVVCHDIETPSLDVSHNSVKHTLSDQEEQQEQNPPKHPDSTTKSM